MNGNNRLELSLLHLKEKHIVNDTRKGYMNLIARILLFLFKYQTDPEQFADVQLLIEGIAEDLETQDLELGGGSNKTSRIFVEDCLTSEFVEFVKTLNGTDSFKQKKIKEALLKKPPHRIEVINFDNISAYHLLYYIIIQKKRNGQAYSFSQYNSCRAAFSYIYTLYEQTKPSNLETQLCLYFTSLKKLTAERAQLSGNINAKGKKPLPFEVYRFILKKFLSSKEMSYVFGHLFITLTWNAMSRSKTTAAIMLKHIDWEGDCLTIQIYQDKNDQCGDINKDCPRHIFANPLIPEICPILSLGLYFLVYDFDKVGKLFHGVKQNDRFREALKGFFKDGPVANELLLYGLTSETLGLHSIRKGSATYCSSGCTACPSQSSIDNRGGWSQGGVKDVYQKPLHAGDQYVGRTVTGLPRLQPEFAILPPFFVNNSNSEFISESIRCCYPGMPDNLFQVLKFCLASVVYHSEFLKEVMPFDHPVFSTPLFTLPSLLVELKKIVVCRLSEVGDIVPTGIPPDIINLLAIKKNYEAIKEVPMEVGAILEEKTILASQVTPSYRKTLLEQHFNQIKVFHQSASSENVALPETGESVQEITIFTHLWGGEFHYLPENYEIPNLNLRLIFLLWFLGNRNERITPLSKVRPSDVRNPKRLSELKFVIKKMMENVFPGNQNNVKNPTISSVNDWYKTGLESLNIKYFLCKDSNRRVGQLKWTTIARELRTKKEE